MIRGIHKMGKHFYGLISIKTKVLDLVILNGIYSLKDPLDTC